MRGVAVIESTARCRRLGWVVHAAPDGRRQSSLLRTVVLYAGLGAAMLFGGDALGRAPATNQGSVRPTATTTASQPWFMNNYLNENAVHAGSLTDASFDVTGDGQTNVLDLMKERTRYAAGDLITLTGAVPVISKRTLLSKSQAALAEEMPCGNTSVYALSLGADSQATFFYVTESTPVGQAPFVTVNLPKGQLVEIPVSQVFPVFTTSGIGKAAFATKSRFAVGSGTTSEELGVVAYTVNSVNDTVNENVFVKAQYHEEDGLPHLMVTPPLHETVNETMDAMTKADAVNVPENQVVMLHKDHQNKIITFNLDKYNMNQTGAHLTLGGGSIDQFQKILPAGGMTVISDSQFSRVVNQSEYFSARTFEGDGLCIWNVMTSASTRDKAVVPGQGNMTDGKVEIQPAQRIQFTANNGTAWQLSEDVQAMNVWESSAVQVNYILMLPGPQWVSNAIHPGPGASEFIPDALQTIVEVPEADGLFADLPSQFAARNVVTTAKNATKQYIGGAAQTLEERAKATPTKPNVLFPLYQNDTFSSMVMTFNLNYSFDTQVTMDVYVQDGTKCNTVNATLKYMEPKTLALLAESEQLTNGYAIVTPVANDEGRGIMALGTTKVLTTGDTMTIQPRSVMPSQDRYELTAQLLYTGPQNQGWWSEGTTQDQQAIHALFGSEDLTRWLGGPYTYATNYTSLANATTLNESVKRIKSLASAQIEDMFGDKFGDTYIPYFRDALDDADGDGWHVDTAYNNQDWPYDAGGSAPGNDPDGAVVAIQILKLRRFCPASDYVEKWYPPNDGRFYLNRAETYAMIRGDAGPRSYLKDLCVQLWNDPRIPPDFGTIDQLEQWFLDRVDGNPYNSEFCTAFDPFNWTYNVGVRTYGGINCGPVDFRPGSDPLLMVYELVKSFLIEYVAAHPECYGGAVGGVPDLSFNPTWNTGDWSPASNYIDKWLPLFGTGIIYNNNQEVRTMLSGDTHIPRYYATALAVVLANSTGNIHHYTADQMDQHLRDLVDGDQTNGELNSNFDPGELNNVTQNFVLRLNGGNSEQYPLSPDQLNRVYDLIRDFLINNCFWHYDLYGGTQFGLPNMDFNPTWITQDAN